MSVKPSIYYNGTFGAHLYEECVSGGQVSPIYIELSDPDESRIEKSPLTGTTLIVSLSTVVMDELAIAWCKHRKLQGTLGGPVGREFGFLMVTINDTFF